MAYIVKDSRGRSPFWIAVYFTTTGRRLKKTTKILVVPIKGDLNESGKQRSATENRKAALAFAEDLERTERLAGLGQLTEAKARTIISAILERATGSPLQHHTVRSWLETWRGGKKGSVSPKTFAKYEQVTNQFIAFLSGRAEINIAAVTPADIIGFRDRLLRERRMPQTVNQLVRKTLSPMFEQARKLGFIPVNPCAAVPSLKTEKVEREVFTPEEIARMVAAAEGDWKGAILIGYYTGARLRDVTNLRWSNCDLTAKVMRFRQTKTGQTVIAPMHPAIEDWLLARSAGMEPKEPVFPKLTGRGTGGAHGLSGRFKAIMAKAAVGAGTVRTGEGKGRTQSSRSFHSLRHSFNSALANAGVAQELRQKLTGHASEEMNKLYTHHEMETLRAAVAKLPIVPFKAK